MEDFPFLHEVRDHARHVFDGNLGIHAVLIEQIDAVGAKTLERPFDGTSDVVGPAVEFLRFIFFDAKAELRGDHDLVAYRCERFATQVSLVWGP